MIAKLRPLPIGRNGFVQSQAQGGVVFSCPIETQIGPGPTWLVNSLNINYTLELKLFSLITVNKREAIIKEGILALEGANTLITESNTLITAQIAQLKVQLEWLALAATSSAGAVAQAEAANAEGGETHAKATIVEQAREVARQLNGTIHATEADIKAQEAAIKNNNALAKANLREIAVMKNELEELALRESQELLRSFTTPVTVTARLVRGVEKEVVWVGSLTPTLLGLGGMNTKFESTISTKPPRFRLTSYPNALLVYESHIPLQPFSIKQAEPLELIITMTGPEQFNLTEEGKNNESGVGILPASGNIIEMNPGAGPVKIAESENSINYEHEP